MQYDIIYYNFNGDVIPFKLFRQQLIEQAMSSGLDMEHFENIIKMVENCDPKIKGFIEEFPQKKNGEYYIRRFFLIDNVKITKKIKRGHPVGSDMMVRVTYLPEEEAFVLDMKWDTIGWMEQRMNKWKEGKK